MSRRRFMTGRRARLNPSSVVGWRKLAKAAQAYDRADVKRRDALDAAWRATKALAVLGVDNAANPCLSLRDVVYGMLFRPVFYQRPDDMAYFAAKVLEACDHEDRLNAAMREAG